MIPEPSPIAWTRPVELLIASHGHRGGYLVVFSEYRPSLFRALANALDFDFTDFRAVHMAPLGWEASRKPLAALNEVINDQLARSQRGLVLHNAEALLAVKGTQERRVWLQQFAAAAWTHPVVVPVAVFAADAPTGSERLCWLDPGTLPSEPLLVRLASR